MKRGWWKGREIKLEVKGNKMIHVVAEDIIFVVEEKHHFAFRRRGDDLEMILEITLLEALTGGTISIPLLGGHETSLEIDDVIYPGYGKILTG